MPANMTFIKALPSPFELQEMFQMCIRDRFLSGLREPLGASVTLSEATAPVKPPA